MLAETATIVTIEVVKTVLKSFLIMSTMLGIMITLKVITGYFKNKNKSIRILISIRIKTHFQSLVLLN